MKTPEEIKKGFEDIIKKNVNPLWQFATSEKIAKECFDFYKECQQETPANNYTEDYIKKAYEAGVLLRDEFKHIWDLSYGQYIKTINENRPETNSSEQRIKELEEGIKIGLEAISELGDFQDGWEAEELKLKSLLEKTKA